MRWFLKFPVYWCDCCFVNCGCNCDICSSDLNSFSFELDAVCVLLIVGQARAEAELAGRQSLAETQASITEEAVTLKDSAQQQFDSIVRVYGETLLRDMETQVC